MSSRNHKSNNIRKYKRKQEMNIGILLFAIVFIYLIVTIFMYATSKRISVYEVREGSIVNDNTYTGLVLRNEVVINAESAGYISYFQNPGSKIKSGSNVYALSPEKLDTEVVVDVSETAISEGTQKNLILKTQNFNENYNAQKFSTVYSLKNDFSTALQSAANQTKTAQLDAAIAANGGSISVYATNRDGIVDLTIDGYETLEETSLKKSDFDRNSYESVSLEDQMKIAPGDPVYKLLLGEDWKIYVELDQATAEALKDTSTVKTRIDKDNETIWADFSIMEIDGSIYGCLAYDTCMIRYCEDRFLTVELILEDESGLKIPKSAVIEKEFYIVPTEYLTTSGSSYSQGVLIKDGNDASYQSVDIYYTTEDGYVYLNPKDFAPDTILIKPESAETFTLNEKRTLQGVYNINKGYAVFKEIEILCENDDYYIVKEGTSYGLYNYDHIVQDGTTVEEEEVVFQ